MTFWLYDGIGNLFDQCETIEEAAHVVLTYDGGHYETRSRVVDGVTVWDLWHGRLGRKKRNTLFMGCAGTRAASEAAIWWAVINDAFRCFGITVMDDEQKAQFDAEAAA